MKALYIKVIIAAVPRGMKKEFNARVNIPSTIPIPDGVGDTMVKRKEMLKPAMSVPIEIGCFDATNTQ